MFKKGSNRKKFEPGGDEEQVNDELQGFMRNPDSQYHIVEETTAHLAQKLAEQGSMLKHTDEEVLTQTDQLKKRPLPRSERSRPS